MRVGLLEESAESVLTEGQAAGRLTDEFVRKALEEDDRAREMRERRTAFALACTALVAATTLVQLVLGLPAL